MNNKISDLEMCVLLRKRKKITQHEISDKLGCSQATISLLENSRIKLDDDLLNQYKKFIENY